MNAEVEIITGAMIKERTEGVGRFAEVFSVDEIEATVTRLEAAEALMLAVEWGGKLDDGRMAQCPWCLGLQPVEGVDGRGHEPDCPAFAAPGVPRR